MKKYFTDMCQSPVLLLISNAIDVTVLNQSPRFQRYHFSSLAALDYLGNKTSSRSPQMLVDILIETIDRVGAQFLLVHMGLAFERYPGEILASVLKVHSLYPPLRIGLDKGLRYAIQSLRISSVSDPRNIRLAIELARHRSIFTMDEETAALVTCLY